MSQNLEVRVRSICDETTSIRSYVLESLDGFGLPAFSAGAHIDLVLPNGMVRSYSLIGDPRDPASYGIAVLRDATGRGGSAFVFDELRVGSIVSVSRPRNKFPLDESAPLSVFFGGGIGITPMLPMVRELERLGRPWKLYYCARNRAGAAFLRMLEIHADKVQFHCDEELGCFLDMRQIISATPAGTHFYCCGPKPMLAGFQAACATLDPQVVHLEHFSGADQSHEGQAFTVHLAKTGSTVQVPADQSILDCLLKAGVDVAYSCREGTCGECEVRVIEGIPDHRDVVLSKKKRAQNNVMLICCSRARSEGLTLDI